MTKHRHFFRFRDLLGILGIYILITLILSAERAGIQVESALTPAGSYLAPEEVLTKEEAFATVSKTCLVLTDLSREDSIHAWSQFQQILLDMKIGYDSYDVSDDGGFPDLAQYRTCILLIPSLECLGENVLAVTDWVEDGGRALFALTLEKTPYFMLISQKLGVLNAGDSPVLVDSFYPEESFMAGGGISYGIADPFDSALSVQLDDQCVVHARTGDERKVPLVWSRDYGSGRFVIDNFGFYEKANRGFFAASISLLEDVCAWPVLDGAVFYLDDFPSPVPGGDGTYVQRDYSMPIADFYANVWWPDMLTLAAKHDIRYTGVIIENYGDDTDEEHIERQKDNARFQYFGNMLLHLGGELGYHGYNHQPLVPDGTDYGEALPYNTWADENAMKKAMEELIEFADESFPTAERSVYVPPSNVISAEGMQVLSDIPEIRTVASTYFPDEFAWTQEFGVEENGLVSQPRFVSGAIMKDYDRMVALSELNMHYVFNHFIHPDDLLDEDRGAELGWEKLKENLYWMFDWLFETAPELRRLTGSQLSAEIQRWTQLTVDMKVSDDRIDIELGNFVDECSLFIRINKGTPGTLEGGVLTEITDTLYLITASEKNLTLTLE